MMNNLLKRVKDFSSIQFSNNMISSTASLPQLPIALTSMKKKVSQSFMESQRSLRKGLLAVLDRDVVTRLQGTLNHATGYDECIQYRRQVVESDIAFRASQLQYQTLKQKYEQSVIEHSRLQKEISSLLERKPSWSDKDVLTFAQLHRQDSQLEQSVSSQRSLVKEAEASVDAAQLRFMEGMRERYQAEQLWSEKMRYFSTWGTCLVLAGQALLLWLSQIWIEPGRREAMVSRIIQETEKTLVSTISTIYTPTLTTNLMVDENLSNDNTTNNIHYPINDLEKDSISPELVLPELSSPHGTVSNSTLYVSPFFSSPNSSALLSMFALAWSNLEVFCVNQWQGMVMGTLVVSPIFLRLMRILFY